jgi:hypothetical protein
VRTETRAGGTEHQSAMDYPSHRSDLANPQRDNRRRRRWDPRPNKWGHRAPHSKPTCREDNSDTNAVKPAHRSIGARGRVLDASHRPNRWALDGSPDPATRPGPLSGRLEQVLPLIPIRERAFRSPAGFRAQAITVQRRFPSRTAPIDDLAQLHGILCSPAPARGSRSSSRT